MAKDDWVKKVHTFRLKKEDEDLYRYLETIPRMRKSEFIRSMLLFALKHMVDPDNVLNGADTNTSPNHSDTAISELKEMLESNNALVNEIKEELTELRSKASFAMTDGNESDDNDEETTEQDTSTEKSVNAMFDAFGIDFSD